MNEEEKAELRLLAALDNLQREMIRLAAAIDRNTQATREAFDRQRDIHARQGDGDTYPVFDVAPKGNDE